MSECDGTLAIEVDVVEELLGSYRDPPNLKVLEALFDEMKRRDDLAGCQRLAALTFDVWEMVMPLVWKDFGDWSSHPDPKEWVAKTLPGDLSERVTFKVDGRRKRGTLEYEGPPNVQLAMQLLWHWCEYVDGEGGKELFAACYSALRRRFMESV